MKLSSSFHKTQTQEKRHLGQFDDIHFRSSAPTAATRQSPARCGLTFSGSASSLGHLAAEMHRSGEGSCLALTGVIVHGHYQ